LKEVKTDLISENIIKFKNLINSNKIIYSPYDGVITAKPYPMIISARPILPSEKKGTPKGLLVMGRFIDESFIESIKGQTHYTIKIKPLNSKGLSQEETSVVKRIQKSGRYIVTDKKGQSLYAFTTFPDIYNNDSLLLMAETKKEMTSQIKRSAIQGLFIVFIGQIIFLVLLHLLIHNLVISPLKKFIKHIKAIESSNDLSLRLKTSSNDEIGLLANSFNQLLRKHSG